MQLSASVFVCVGSGTTHDCGVATRPMRRCEYQVETGDGRIWCPVSGAMRDDTGEVDDPTRVTTVNLFVSRPPAAQPAARPAPDLPVARAVRRKARPTRSEMLRSLAVERPSAGDYGQYEKERFENVLKDRIRSERDAMAQRTREILDELVESELRRSLEDSRAARALQDAGAKTEPGEMLATLLRSGSCGSRGVSLSDEVVAAVVEECVELYERFLQLRSTTVVYQANVHTIVYLFSRADGVPSRDHRRWLMPPHAGLATALPDKKLRNPMLMQGDACRMKPRVTTTGMTTLRVVLEMLDDKGMLPDWYE